MDYGVTGSRQNDSYKSIEESFEAQDTTENISPETYGIFFRKKVSSIVDFDNSLPSSGKPIGENKSIHSRNIKFIILRFGFLVANTINRMLFRNPHNVSIYKKENITFATKDHTKNYQTVEFSASDKVLLDDLKPGNSKFFFKNDQRQIFDKNTPISPFDVRQNDNRSSCYLLSMLISYASTDNIKNLISENMITELDNNKVKVSFINQQYGIKFDIIVEKNNLITNDHNFVYSSNESSETAWASVIEKAYHGLRTLLKNSLTDDSILENLNLSAGAIEQIKFAIVQDMAGSVAKTGNSLDYANSKYSASFLPKVPTISQQIEGFKQVENLQQYSFTKNKNNAQNYTKTLNIIFKNAQLGIPINVNSKAKSNIFDKIRLAFQGIPTSHAIAVVGTATKEKTNGQKVDGLLLFDPYANPRPSKKLIDAIENGTEIPMDINNAESCIKFIPLEDMHKYFEECVIVAGGFVAVDKKIKF